MPAPKKRTKWTRVAVSGFTADKRQINKDDINQMAETYNQAIYDARVFVEHIRGYDPDSAFGAYGSVIAAKAEDYSVNGNNERALYVQLDANENLVVLNKKNQKIYTSIEIGPNFANSGKAYLVGLGVTDSPSSLCTEALQFCIDRKQDKNNNLFTAAIETIFEFEEEEPINNSDRSILKSIFSALINKEEPAAESLKPPKNDDNNALLFKNIDMNFFALESKYTSLEKEHTSLKNQFNQLQEMLTKLAATPANENFNHKKIAGSDPSEITETNC